MTKTFATLFFFIASAFGISVAPAHAQDSGTGTFNLASSWCQTPQTKLTCMMTLSTPVVLADGVVVSQVSLTIPNQPGNFSTGIVSFFTATGAQVLTAGNFTGSYTGSTLTGTYSGSDTDGGSFSGSFPTITITPVRVCYRWGCHYSGYSATGNGTLTVN